MSEELFSQEGKLINKVKEFEIGKKGVWDYKKVSWL
jgi:hypothetical protein